MRGNKKSRVIGTMASVVVLYMALARFAPLQHTETTVDRTWTHDAIESQSSPMCADVHFTSKVIIDQPYVFLDLPFIAPAGGAILEGATTRVDITDCMGTAVAEPTSVDGDPFVVVAVVAGDSTCDQLLHGFVTEGSAAGVDGCRDVALRTQVSGQAGKWSELGGGTGAAVALKHRCVELTAYLELREPEGANVSVTREELDVPDLCPGQA